MRTRYYNLVKFIVFLLAVAIVILLYRTYYPEEFVPSFNSTCEVNVTQICDIDIPDCPDCPSCSNVCNFPEDLDIDLNIINNTG